MKNLILATVIAVGASLAGGFTARADLRIEKTDFQSLYNSYRFSQADPLPWPGTYWAYEGNGRGSGINHVPPGATKSPAQKYDGFFGLGNRTATWEEQHHTCANVPNSAKEGCRTWYGHCNGWTGAALFNPEPDYDHPITVTNPETNATETFNYVDLKALLSEAWLDAYVSYEGTGMTVEGGDWIFDPNAAISKQPADNNSDLTNYEAYWDVSPRALFYALTNYTGMQKTGIALDRFTGSEIWNQPLIGYRFMPISGSAQPITQNGRQVYPVDMGVKLYWANDEVAYDFKRTDSLNWNIADANFSTDKIPNPVASEYAQERTRDGAVISRYIAFTLFFDAPVVVGNNGTQITSGGKMLGDGVWAHADPAVRNIWFGSGNQASQTHPDFLWRPDHIVMESDYRNPNIDPVKIYKYILQKPVPDGKQRRTRTPRLEKID